MVVAAGGGGLVAGIVLARAGRTDCRRRAGELPVVRGRPRGWRPVDSQSHSVAASALGATRVGELPFSVLSRHTVDLRARQRRGIARGAGPAVGGVPSSPSTRRRRPVRDWLAGRVPGDRRLPGDLRRQRRVTTVSRPFDAVEIVFNPNSTGDAKELAQGLAGQLAERAPELAVQLRPTERAGHGREIARDAARAGRPLVVSVSGDGGYNDVVNGLMEAGADSAYAAVLAAGNANDHRRVTRERPLADAIVEGDVSRLDLLRLTTDDDREARYAHSYIGLGITPTVALELEKGGKGSIREVISTIVAFLRFRPFERDRDRRRPRELRQCHLRQHPRDGEGRGPQRRGPAGRRRVRGDRAAAHREVAGAGDRRAGGAAPGWARSRRPASTGSRPWTRCRSRWTARCRSSGAGWK